MNCSLFFIAFFFLEGREILFHVNISKRNHSLIEIFELRQSFQHTSHLIFMLFIFPISSGVFIQPVFHFSFFFRGSSHFFYFFRSLIRNIFWGRMGLKIFFPWFFLIISIWSRVQKSASSWNISFWFFQRLEDSLFISETLVFEFLEL